jgi:hypothetical protein
VRWLGCASVAEQSLHSLARHLQLRSTRPDVPVVSACSVRKGARVPQGWGIDVELEKALSFDW